MFITKSMTPNEEIRKVCPIHKITFLVPLLVTMFGALPTLNERLDNLQPFVFDNPEIFLDSLTLQKNPSPKLKSSSKFAALVFPFTLFGIGLFIVELLVVFNTERILTNKRIFYHQKKGRVPYYTIQTDEMKIDELAYMSIEQTFFGKIFNYGTLCFLSGVSGKDVQFPLVPNPARVRREYEDYFAQLDRG